MTSTTNSVKIIRTERGLSISGTRLSLYDVMDCLKAGHSPEQVRNNFNLTDNQIEAALSYLEAERDRVEAEYREVLHTRAEIRSYWEDRNRQRFARIAKMQRQGKRAALWDKLKQQKAERLASL